MRRSLALGLGLLLACGGSADAQPKDEPSPPPHVAPLPKKAPPRLDAERYAWLADNAAAMPTATESLERRFSPPPDFSRVGVDAGSFGAFLRGLPLAAPGTAVVTYRGDLVLPGDHEHLAAVVAIDSGTRDLMQCADSVIRMHAEWRWSTGARDASYRALAGPEMPFSRYLQGDRARANGSHLAWQRSAAPARADHPAYRRWLDDVFMFANTISLANEAKPVARADLAPGDFVVLPGGPGHAVLVLDLARAEDGRVALLLGQGFMPAQGFYVVRPSRASAWFVVEPGDATVTTPFWKPFPWSSLRRLSETKA
jgi:Domain of unknown function (4846)